MPNLDNAKKALRQSKKREAHNKRYRIRVKKLTKEISELIKAEKFADAQKLLPKFYKAVDKAAKKNILNKNTAARRKSVMTKQAQKTNTQAKTEAAKSSQAK